MLYVISLALVFQNCKSVRIQQLKREAKVDATTRTKAKAKINARAKATTKTTTKTIKTKRLLRSHTREIDYTYN